MGHLFGAVRVTEQVKCIHICDKDSNSECNWYDLDMACMEVKEQIVFRR